MRFVFLLLALLAFTPNAFAHEHKPESIQASVDCDCPPDCHCKKPGGTCEGGVCVRGCECDRRAVLYVHPLVQESIRDTELRMALGRAPAPDYVWVNGVKQFTGFRPTQNMYRGARTINFKADPKLELPRTFSLRDFSHSPVRGQLQGSCWAEGNVSAFELTWNAIMGTKLVFSVDDVIHCSGFGTARGGGQLSMEYDVGGLAYEADYPYTARDGKCRKDVERHYALKEAPFLRGANGGFPTVQELKQAIMQYGAMEICGSASALGGGGRQETVRTSGRTDHCYALAGWRDEKYFDIKNSWGDCDDSNPLSNGRCWGDKGWGEYPFSKDGVKIVSSVITEIQVGNTGRPLRPREPVTFNLESAEVTLTAVVQPNDLYTADEAKAQLELAMKSLGE